MKDELPNVRGRVCCDPSLDVQPRTWSALVRRFGGYAPETTCPSRRIRLRHGVQAWERSAARMGPPGAALHQPAEDGKAPAREPDGPQEGAAVAEFGSPAPRVSLLPALSSERSLLAVAQRRLNFSW